VKGPAKAKVKVETTADAQGLLSQKLDAMLKDAKIDGELMASLGNSIKKFESLLKELFLLLTELLLLKKYSEELTTAAAQMESLNSLYKSIKALQEMLKSMKKLLKIT
jgi:hypothetical protein